MKKFTVLLLTLLFSASILRTPASALIPPNTGAHSCQVFTEGINNAYWEQAEMLNKLGLLLGTGNGFALERGMTRAEAAAMLVRFLGEEKTALSQNWQHPFLDVPDWADRYIGWLYQNKLTKGTSETKYSPGRYVTYWQYATFLSRALAGHDDFLASYVGKAEEQALSESNQSFLRADAVALSTRVLGCYREWGVPNPKTMARNLIDKDVFTATQWFEAARNIFPLEYWIPDTQDRVIEGLLAGVPVVKSALKGVGGTTLGLGMMTSQPHFYSWTYEDDGALALYQMDCLTLKETRLGRYPRNPSLQQELAPTVTCFNTIDGSDYLRVDQYDYSTVVRVGDGTAETVIDKIVYENCFVSDKAILITGGGDVYVLTDGGSRRRTLSAGGAVVGLVDEVAVVCRRENGKAVVEGINVDTWTVTDTYEVALSGATLTPDLRQYSDGIYGEAGYYAVSEGRLRQITARPTLAVGIQRVGAGNAWVIVSHEPGQQRGTVIVQVGYTWEFGGEERVWLSNDPPHGIEISGLDYSETSGAIQFYTRIPVGMENYDVYTYDATNFRQGQPEIWVKSYKPGRPEMMEHDESWYVQREQDRLNALGYGINS